MQRSNANFSDKYVLNTFLSKEWVRNSLFFFLDCEFESCSLEKDEKFMRNTSFRFFFDKLLSLIFFHQVKRREGIPLQNSLILVADFFLHSFSKTVNSLQEKLINIHK